MISASVLGMGVADITSTWAEIVGANRRLSMTQAAILAALDYADKAAKESEAADNLRGQIKEYLEDSARYKMEAEVARRDVERLHIFVQSESSVVRASLICASVAVSTALVESSSINIFGFLISALAIHTLCF